MKKNNKNKNNKNKNNKKKNKKKNKSICGQVNPHLRTAYESTTTPTKTR